MHRDPRGYCRRKKVPKKKKKKKKKKKLIINRVRPLIDPRLDECQAEFRYGFDAQVYALVEILRLRQSLRTYCAFLNIRMAFDVAWRDSAMLRLHRAGIPDDLKHLVDDVVSDRSAAVRLDSQFSPTWDVEDGIGQRVVLRGFLCNILINGLAAAIKRACVGATCGLQDGLQVKVLLYADDIVILNYNPADLQRALDAAHSWAMSWRFHFGVGPSKSAVMIFGRGRGRARVPAFFLGGHLLPLQENLLWKNHIEHLLDHGERKMAACLFWTGSAELSPTFVERIYQAYVHPSINFGLEFVPYGPQLARYQTRIYKWGRRILGWPAGSPSVGVQGQLGWHDANTIRLLQAAGLWARLVSLPQGCFVLRRAGRASCVSKSVFVGIIPRAGVEVCRCPAAYGNGVFMPAVRKDLSNNG